MLKSIPTALNKKKKNSSEQTGGSNEQIGGLNEQNGSMNDMIGCLSEQNVGLSQHISNMAASVDDHDVKDRDIDQ